MENDHGSCRKSLFDVDVLLLVVAGRKRPWLLLTMVRRHIDEWRLLLHRGWRVALLSRLKIMTPNGGGWWMGSMRRV